MSNANDRQVGGSHYRSGYQHWDFVHDVGMNYLEAQVAKYITRHRNKGGLEDVKKALHFCEKLQAVQANALKEILREYVVTNDLTEEESWVILCLIKGNYAAAGEYLRGIIADYDGAEPQPHGYVNQD